MLRHFTEYLNRQNLFCKPVIYHSGGIPDMRVELRDPLIWGPESYEIKVFIPVGTELRGVYPNYYFVTLDPKLREQKGDE